MSHRDLSIRIAFYAFMLAFIALCSAIALSAPAPQDAQITGQVMACEPDHIIVKGLRLQLSPETHLYSQAHARIHLSEICKAKMVSVAYHQIGTRLIADQIKLLDRQESAAHKRFSGKVRRVEGDAFSVGEQTIHLDAFTIRLGKRALDANVKHWLGANMTVIAVQNDAGQWIAEVVREGFELAAMVRD